MARPIQRRQDYRKEAGIILGIVRVIEADESRDEQWKFEVSAKLLEVANMMTADAVKTAGLSVTAKHGKTG